MTAPYFLNFCKWSSTTAGTGAFTVGAAAAADDAGAHDIPANCSVVDGNTYRYFARSADGTQTELGRGIYHSATHTLARTEIINNSDGTTTPVNFLTDPIVDMFPSPINSLLPGVLNYTPVNKAGDTMTGSLVINGDVTAERNGPTGVIYLGNAGSHYVYFDGTNYNMPGGYIAAGNGRLWGASDWSCISQPMINARLAFLADYNFGPSPSAALSEPYSGGVMTGIGFDGSNNVIGRMRQLQVQGGNGVWYACGYV